MQYFGIWIWCVFKKSGLVECFKLALIIDFFAFGFKWWMRLWVVLVWKFGFLWMLWSTWIGSMQAFLDGFVWFCAFSMWVVSSKIVRLFFNCVCGLDLDLSRDLERNWKKTDMWIKYIYISRTFPLPFLIFFFKSLSKFILQTQLLNWMNVICSSLTEIKIL